MACFFPPLFHFAFLHFIHLHRYLNHKTSLHPPECCVWAKSTFSSDTVECVSAFCHHLTFNVYSFQKKVSCSFLSLLAIKIQGLCKITGWRTKLEITGCHVYPSSPKSELLMTVVEGWRLRCSYKCAGSVAQYQERFSCHLFCGHTGRHVLIKQLP